jgi:transketolase
LAVEAGASLGWSKYVGLDGDTVTWDDFGASAPYKEIRKHLGFTVENVVAKSRALIKKTRP